MPKMLTIILLLGLLPYECNRTTPIKSQPQQKEDQALDPEWEMELNGELLGGENRPQVRQAAVDYARAVMPDSRVLGVASFPYTGTLYIVGLDLQSAEKKQTANVVVRLFVQPQGGKTYWKADLLSPELMQTLRSGYERRRYQDLEDDLEKKESGPD